MSQNKQAPKKSLLSSLAVVVVAVLLLIGQQMGLLPGLAQETPTSTAAPTETAQAFYIIEPQALVNYLDAHDGELPDNFLTKAEAQALGWDSSKNYLSDVAPGKSIGGDRFGNYEKLLPTAKGRTYREADCYYEKGKRNACRLVFSNDGLYFYTEDHYASFEEMFPEEEE